MKFFAAVVIVLVTVFSSLFIARAFGQCHQSNGIGEVFYDFDNIIIYYAGYIHPRDLASPEMPPELQFEAFSSKLTEAVRKNFGLCAKNAAGLPKKIVTMAPTRTVTHGELMDLNIDQIHDPRNLTIVVSVSYAPGQSIGLNSKEDFGTISFFFYRPDIKYKQGRIPLPNNSGINVFFPKQGKEELERRLAQFFDRIKPMQTGKMSGDILFVTPK